jgi:S1-C subfamily serine protease
MLCHERLPQGDIVKKFLAFALAIAMAISPAFAKKSKPSDSFNGFDPHEVEEAAVGAISIPNQNPANGDGSYAMICSGSLIAYDSDGNGIFLTARHCVWDEENGGFIPNEVVSFRGNLKGPYYQTELLEVAPNDDLAVLRVVNAESASHPIIPEVIESDSEFEQLVAGSPIENVSFPLDIGRVEFHGNFIDSEWPHWSRFLQSVPQWKRTMPTDITIGPGSSGSPLFDSQTHKLIGVMVGSFTSAGRLTIAESPIAISDILNHPEKNTALAFAQANSPKEEPFHLPQRNQDAERHPLIPGFGQI